MVEGTQRTLAAILSAEVVGYSQVVGVAETAKGPTKDTSRRTWLTQVTAFSFVFYALVPTVFAQKRPRRVVEVRIKNRQVIAPATAIKLAEGDLVELRWKSDEQLELHLHGYDLKLVVLPGEPGVMAFRAFASGRFPITSHGWGDGGHGHEPLTYLEVHPP
ncbi:MAG: hypothetical protein VCF08_24745 [Alphaproteobacteria bacterium]